MIDSHAHLTDERFQPDLDAVLQRARDAGVQRVVTIGTNLADARAALDLAAREPLVAAAVGIHPHSAGSAAVDLVELRDLASEGAVALGETGLDYHYDFAPRDAQRRLFLRHLQLGAELDLPVVVHARTADDDVAAVLREHAREVRGVLHCFSGGAALLEAALEIGWFVSFAGMVSFRNYADAELVRSVPLDRMLVETDSPYLSPVPLRGRRNEPSHLPHTIAALAGLLGLDAAYLGERTADNARRLYRLAPHPSNDPSIG